MSRLLQKLKFRHRDQLQSERINFSYALYSYLEQTSFKQANMNKVTDEKLLLDFVFLCLSLVYWRERQKDFFSRVKMFLEPLKELLDFDTNFCQRLYNLQVCTIDSQNTLYEIVKRQAMGSLGSGEKLRILPDGKKCVISLILSSDGILSVRSYLPYGVIYDGQIWPLSDGTHLKYSPEMDLLTDHLHILNKSQNDFYFIRKTKDTFAITGVSGVTFAPNSFDQVKTLENHNQMYYHLKRLEQFFIDRSTDPYYRDLVHLLETQVQDLSRNSQGVSESIKVYEKVWSIFDRVFRDDKLLSLLLRQLSDKIEQVRVLNDVKHTKESTIKSSLSPEWGM